MNAEEDVLGFIAEVLALTNEVLLEIKDIEEVTTKEAVFAALQKVLEGFKTSVTYLI